jgi:hypothetical protein
VGPVLRPGENIRVTLTVRPADGSSFGVGVYVTCPQNPLHG